jgi:putative transposase
MTTALRCQAHCRADISEPLVINLPVEVHDREFGSFQWAVPTRVCTPLGSLASAGLTETPLPTPVIARMTLLRKEGRAPVLQILVWPEGDGELAAFTQRLTVTHVRRWQQNRGYSSLGHVYQGRYKSFPVESDEHFWVVARYVERNALRANLVLRAEQWRWSSLWRRYQGTREEKSLLARWPVEVSRNWIERVNQADYGRELEALRRCVQRGRPYGRPEWQKEIAKRLGLVSAYRPVGRPRKVGTVPMLEIRQFVFG